MFPVEHLFGNKYFYGYGRTYSLTSTSILNIKTHLMKSTFYSFLRRYLSLFFGCANDAIEIPKLRCTQPDFNVNKMVAEIRTNAMIVTNTPTMISFMWFPVMKTVIFLKLFLYRL
jgi:hypothetical protein